MGKFGESLALANKAKREEFEQEVIQAVNNGSMCLAFSLTRGSGGAEVYKRIAEAVSSEMEQEGLCLEVSEENSSDTLIWFNIVPLKK